MKFTLQHKDPSSQARAGELQTDHGVVKTPIFMPVGTAATVKGIFHRDVRDEARAQIILANTYHLYLRPGMDILERAGGVHRFSTWDGPMLTDSGGFQVFSLAGCRKLKEEGCHFQSHIDGSRHLFTPESVIDTERTIGADIMMAFDECPPGDSPRDYAAKSLALTERWLDRCFNRYRQTSPKYGHYQALFPIVHGCTYPDLRARAAENVKQYDADVLAAAEARNAGKARVEEKARKAVFEKLREGLDVAPATDRAKGKADAVRRAQLIDLVNKAVDGKADELLAGSKDGSVYDALLDEVENGRAKDVQAEINRLLTAGKDKGSIKSKITEAVKEEYLAGSDGDRERLEKKLLALEDAEGSPLYEEKNFVQWVKDADKKAEKAKDERNWWEEVK